MLLFVANNFIFVSHKILKHKNVKADVQKIIRNAKKMQDKLPIFYKVI